MSKRKIFTFKNKRHIPRFLLWLVAWILRIYAWTFRVRFVNGDVYLAEQPLLPVVFTVWHNRILFLPSLAPKKLRKKCAVLISNSRDGEYIAGLVKEFGVEAVRGSSSKGALHALHGLSEAIARNVSPLITLDGPRGPKYKPHLGAVSLAMQHGIPIVPFSINASSYWQLKSWDNLQVPRPFAKLELIFGQPLTIPQGTSRDEALEMLQVAMNGVTKDK